MLKREDFFKIIKQVKKKGRKTIPYKDLTAEECEIIFRNGFNVECDGKITIFVS